MTTELFYITIFILASLLAAAVAAYIIIDRKYATLNEKIQNGEISQRDNQDNQLLNHSSQTVSEPEKPFQPGSILPDKSFTPDRELARDYLFKFIERMGCQPSFDNDGNVHFKYQGEEFHLEYNGINLRIWDPAWLRVHFSHPSFAHIMRSVNETNFGFGPTLVFSRPDDEGNVVFHSRMDLYFPYFTENDPKYLAALLNSYFDLKRNFSKIMSDSTEEGLSIPNPFAMDPVYPSAN